MPIFKSDQDYIDAGVVPPEHIVHQGSDTLRPTSHAHVWIHQGGAFLHCSGGDHGIPFDHLHVKLMGTTPEGAPILEPIVLSDRVPGIKWKTKVKG